MPFGVRLLKLLEPLLHLYAPLLLIELCKNYIQCRDWNKNSAGSICTGTLFQTRKNTRELRRVYAVCLTVGRTGGRTGGFVAEHGVDLIQDFGVGGGVSQQREERPGQHGGGRLVPRDEHGHEIVAQLLVRQVSVAHVHQESQQRRISHLRTCQPCQ